MIKNLLEVFNLNDDGMHQILDQANNSWLVANELHKSFKVNNSRPELSGSKINEHSVITNDAMLILQVVKIADGSRRYSKSGGSI